MLRTYQPKKLHRKKEHGFRKRMSDRNGRKVLALRQGQGQRRLSTKLERATWCGLSLLCRKNDASPGKRNGLFNGYFYFDM